MNQSCTVTFTPAQLHAYTELCNDHLGLFINTSHWEVKEGKPERLVILVNVNDFEGPGADAREITPNELVECWQFVESTDYYEHAAWVWVVMHLGLKPWSRREDSWEHKLDICVNNGWVTEDMLKMYQEKIKSK
jgi:hypothetical protein